MKKLIQAIFFLILTLTYSLSKAQISVVASAGTTNGSYSTIKNVFDAINLGTHQGIISIQITGNITETASAKLNASGSGGSSYSAITIQPAPNNNASITGNINGKLIELNGADNVTINGINTSGNSLTIENTYIGSSFSLCTIFLGNDANNNTITKTILKGACQNSGIVLISNGVLSGNDYNTISDCHISNSVSTHYYCGIYLLSSTGKENSYFNITNNSINNSTWGIYITGNNDDGTISGNKIYQSNNRTVSFSDLGGIYLFSGDRNTINNNYIGSSSSNNTGYTQISSTSNINYYGIKIDKALEGKTNLFSNTIAKIVLVSTSSTSTIRGIDLTNGIFNVGVNGGNSIGEFNSDSSLVVIGSTINIRGIELSNTFSTTIANNIMGGLLASPNSFNVRGTLYGVLVTNQKDSLFITDNTIGNGNIPHSVKIGDQYTTGKGSECIGIKIGSSSPINNLNYICSISQNTINNIECYGVNGNGRLYGVYYSDAYTVQEGLVSIKNNTIKNLKTNADDTPSGNSLVTVLAGVYITTTARPSEIGENKIDNLYALREGSVKTLSSGIVVNLFHNLSIYKNTIHSIYNSAQNTNTDYEPLSIGIYINKNFNQAAIFNNMVSLEGFGNKKIIGIFYDNQDNQHNTKIFHNTINIFGLNASGSLPSFCFLVKSTYPTSQLSNFEVKNNIFNNSRSGGTGSHFAIGSDCLVSEFKSSKWQPGISNYNVLNANPSTIGYYLGPHNFTSWKNIFSNDIKSYTGVTPIFNNEQMGDLHLINTGPTSLESGGIPLPTINSDFDGQIRPGPAGSIHGGATKPDLGADEFDGVPPPSMIYLSSTTEQVTGSAYIGKSKQAIIRIKITTQNRYLPLNLTSLTLNAVGTTNINDINIGFARIYYTAGTNIFDTTYYFGMAQPTLSSFNVSGTQTLEEGDNYFWLSFDVSGAAQDGNLIDAQCTSIILNNTFVPLITNPIGAKEVRGPMKGTYIIGVGNIAPNFSTITTALNDLNNRGVSGSVVLELADTLYSNNEIFPLVIKEVPGASSTNSVKLIPSINTKVTIRGNSPNSEAILKLISSDFITIDGLNGLNSSLSFQNTSLNEVSAVIWLVSLGTGNGASNNSVLNCRISAGLPINTSTGFSYGIIASGHNLTGYPTQLSGGFDNHNCQFINNVITKVTFGIYFNGGDYNNLSSNTIIKGNNIGTEQFSDNHIGICGITSTFVENLTITENNIKSVGGDYKNIKSSWTRCGISLSNGVEYHPAKTVVKRAKIVNNTIENVVDERQNSAIGIQVIAGNKPIKTDINVSNNSICNVKSNNNSSKITAGIAYFAGYYDTIAFNSINLFGDTDPDPTTYSSEAARFGFFMGSSLLNDTFNVVIANNNIRNELYSSSYANYNNVGIGIEGPYVWESGYCNNNNYYLDPLRSHSFIGSIEKYYSGTLPYRTNSLQNWTITTNQDSNSRTIKPIFNNDYDLHLVQDSNPYLNNRGIGIVGFNLDIDSESRNQATPDIGIDEYTPNGCSAQPQQGFFSVPFDSICSGEKYVLNPSGLTQEIGVIYQWKTGPSGGPYQPVTSGTGPTSVMYTTPQLITGTHYYIIESTCINTGQSNQSNEFKLKVNQKPSVNLTPGGNNILCGDEVMHFEVTSDIANSFQWKKDGIIIPGQISNIYTTSEPGSYRAIVKVLSTMCQDSSTSVIVDKIPAPDPIVLNTTYLDVCHDTIIPLIAKGGNVVQYKTLGEDVLSNTETSPYKGLWGGNKVQYIINANELLTSGLTQFDTITDISLKILDFQGPYIFQNLCIGLKNSNINQLNSTFETGFTTVVDPVNFSINTNGPQLLSHKFDHPFSWDGISNLLIEYCYNNNNSGGTSTNSANIESSISSLPNSAHYYSANNSAQLCSEVTEGALSNLRPNITFQIKKHLPKSWSPLIGLYNDPLTLVPYTGTDKDTVYAKATTNITYFVSTNNLSCISQDTSSINITQNEVLNNNNAGPGSLRRAIECSENGDTVHISLSTIFEIELLSKILIDKQLSIIDDFTPFVKLKYNYQSPILQSEYNGSLRIAANGSLRIENLEIQHIGETNIHPCIVNLGELIMKNCKIKNSSGNSWPILIKNTEGGQLIFEEINTIK